MLDFMEPAEMHTSKKSIVIYPRFIVTSKSKDLMIRGNDFYAVWNENKHRWSMEEDDLIDLVDKELMKYANEKYPDQEVSVLRMRFSDSGSMEKWRSYTKKHMRNNYHELDDELCFLGDEKDKDGYSSHCLPYALAPGEHTNWDRLMSVLYSPEEARKIEWAIGSVISGDSKTIQKFLVFYGSAGTGKSTVLNIIQMLFEGYYGTFDAKALGDPNNQFALESLTKNPLVAIQHDGDLSRIEDNTRLNSIVSHEEMSVNEKFKSIYTVKFRSLLLMGTNRPVKITDAKSGILRRLIDVSPTGNTLTRSEYNKVMKGIKFELGAIAKHCLDVYEEDPGYYDDYTPIGMLDASNDFYNFVEDSYTVFKRDDVISLKTAWDMYKAYCDDARVPYPLSQRVFKEELKNYFEDYKERYHKPDNTFIRNVYVGFKTDKFTTTTKDTTASSPTVEEKLIFEEQHSVLDDILAECPAQYAANYSGMEQPERAWANVTTKLKDLDTSQCHYILPPCTHIFVDFDIPDENGNKSFEKNLEAASKWPLTYAELSKSGAGIHLHYIYTGDVSKLSNIYGDHIEIKTFKEGSKAGMRRKLTKCFNHPLTELSSGLPLKGEKMVDFSQLKDEKHLRNIIKKYLRKDCAVPYTKPCCDLIAKTLEEAYASGMSYDISNMYTQLIAFAMSSSHQAEACIKIVNSMKLSSENTSKAVENTDERDVFFDCEVFPNLLLINWKYAGKDEPMVRMINPSPMEVEQLMEKNLIGFNNLRYDNHILYARHIGYDNAQIYHLSQSLVKGEPRAGFLESKNVSKTDIYDFSSKKQSLKKFEIEMGFTHKELGMSWDEPVPEDKWIEVSEYCDNDVLATEALFNTPDRQADYLGRQILAEIADMSVNDTTNALTTKIIFGSDRKPQSQFNYRNMGDISGAHTHTVDESNNLYDFEDPYVLFDDQNRPVFPGYKFEYDPDKKKAVSTYRGEEVGEGGYVYAEPGMYGNVALLDVKSMHPSSIVAENLFGKYTQRFKDIKDARVAIKEKRYDDARKMLDGKLAKFIDDVESGKLSNKQLAGALKIAINSVYGLTAAKFDNPFRDIRNKDNIVAKRGALFMVNLKNAVQARGYKVAHIKTDSIKVPDATPEIIEFIMEFGRMYGYEFDHEATYERMCLVNDAVYIARYKNEDGSIGDWTATGAQFAVPYIYKTLFTKEPLDFSDLCVTKTVASSAMYLDFNENNTDEHNLIFVGKVGEFCPVEPGTGGGLLVRSATAKDGSIKYDSVVGCKGYRFKESAVVLFNNLQDTIDKRYFKAMADDAIDTIKKYGDYDWFVSDEPYVPSAY